MSREDKLVRLASLRDMREKRCLGKLAQARAKKRTRQAALERARDGHALVAEMALTQHREVLVELRTERDHATIFARIALCRARGEAAVERSLEQIEKCRLSVVRAGQVADSAQAAHKESQRDLERITALLKEARWGQAEKIEQVEEDEIAELFGSTVRKEYLGV